MAHCKCSRKKPASRKRLIKHDETRYNVGQAKKHLKHHKGTKLLRKQIEAQEERTEKE